MIERQMISAILSCKDWRNDNTRVAVTYFAHAAYPIKRISVCLYDNNIATIENDEITINNCGWKSATTKSRLNAILSELSDAHIYQKDHEWYLETPEALVQMENLKDYTVKVKQSCLSH